MIRCVMAGSSTGLSAPAPCPCLQASILHAAAVAVKGSKEQEEAVVELLLQASEAAVHGVLRFKSAQLLVRSRCPPAGAAGGGSGGPGRVSKMQQLLEGLRAALLHHPAASVSPALPSSLSTHSHASTHTCALPSYPTCGLQAAAVQLLQATSGLLPCSDRRRKVYRLLLEHGSEEDTFSLSKGEKLEDSRALPVSQLERWAGPTGTAWWKRVPASQWLQPAAEAVGRRWAVFDGWGGRGSLPGFVIDGFESEGQAESSRRCRSGSSGATWPCRHNRVLAPYPA